MVYVLGVRGIKIGYKDVLGIPEETTYKDENRPRIRSFRPRIRVYQRSNLGHKGVSNEVKKVWQT